MLARYRHSIPTISANVFRARRFASRAALTSAPKVSKPVSYTHLDVYKRQVTTGTTERNWVTLFKQYENVEELNRRVLMSLVDRILIHDNHAIEIVFKYRDEYQQTIEYVLGYADELDIAV